MNGEWGMGMVSLIQVKLTNFRGPRRRRRRRKALLFSQQIPKNQKTFLIFFFLRQRRCRCINAVTELFQADPAAIFRGLRVDYS